MLNEHVNEYGNVDISAKVPDGLTWAPGKRLAPTARAAGIEHAPALRGFRKRGRDFQPVIDGIVFNSQDEPKWNEALERREKRAKGNTPGNRAARKRARQDREREEFTEAIAERYPGMPTDARDACATRATEIGSGRVGRSTTAEDPIRAAVVAYARHRHTDYDGLLGSGYDREEARAGVSGDIAAILTQWETEQ